MVLSNVPLIRRCWTVVRAAAAFDGSRKRSWEGIAMILFLFLLEPFFAIL